jgi:hypothetical protein
MGYLGGTAALHYGLLHADKVSLIVSGTYDPDPQQTPASRKMDNYPVRKTHLEAMEAVWGKKEWALKTAEQRPGTTEPVVWVQANPKVNLPFCRWGAGRCTSPGRGERSLKAPLATGQPFWTGFTWRRAAAVCPLYVRRPAVPGARPPRPAPRRPSARLLVAALGYWMAGDQHGVGWDVDTSDTRPRLRSHYRSGGRMASATQSSLAPGEIRWEQAAGERRPAARRRGCQRPADLRASNAEN